MRINIFLFLVSFPESARLNTGQSYEYIKPSSPVQSPDSNYSSGDECLPSVSDNTAHFILIQFPHCLKMFKTRLRNPPNYP